MPLLVLLNGIGDMPQVWQDQVTSLSPGYKAVAPWVRGTRPGRNETFEMDAAADDVLALLNQHGVEQMDVCGLGLGAMVDGGFAMGSNLPLFAYGEGEGGGDAGTTITNSEGEQVVVPKKADFGTVSSGGLY